MLNSKQLIEITGISRATLNNYVAMGILPSPEVRTPEGGSSRATRLGYFAEETVEVIQQVQQLKRDGLTMAQIAEQLGQRRAGDAPLSSANSGTSQKANPPALRRDNETQRVGDLQDRKSTSLTLKSDLNELPGPAYLVNHDFELRQWNRQAESGLLGAAGNAAGQKSINLLAALLDSPLIDSAQQLTTLLKPHVAAARQCMSQQALLKLYSSLDSEKHALLKQCFDAVSAAPHTPTLHYPALLPASADGSTRAQACDLYIGFYEEGVLFTYLPLHSERSHPLDLFSSRNPAAQELLSAGKPRLTRVATLVASLHNAAAIKAELPAEDYFRLMNTLRQRCEPVFRSYYSLDGKHGGPGFARFFFPHPNSDYRINAIECALKLRSIAHNLTLEWQAEKGWFTPLQLNVGLHEGEEWLGSIHAGSQVECSLLGDTADLAEAISQFADGGSVWISKSMLEQIPAPLRKHISFGITRKTLNQEPVFASETFTSLNALKDGIAIDAARINKKSLKQIGSLPLTQIRNGNSGY